MNIQQAKQTIKNTVRLYLKKDAFGEYEVPVASQRPIFLLGAPGIGKTAILEQVAQELGIALVSYSMTHHTRQSALGLPFITRKSFGGEEYSVSEYTMSEIIAAVYETMEASGIREGILFLDEINCVSETLAPSMLQFLQYKTFGRHKVPDGWVIVTAGNPPEYNRSVREFDVVTLDRLKVLEVEPDFKAWREYAADRQLHGAILNFLDLQKDFFYVMETTAKGRAYVTARGWEDLSRILELYEEERLPAGEELIGQYLRSERVAKEFAAYYDLYNKYKRDYPVAELLAGQAGPAAVSRARAAKFDERLSLLGMLLDKVTADMREAMEQADVLAELRPVLRGAKKAAESAKQNAWNGDKTAGELLRVLAAGVQARRKALDSRKSAGALSDEERRRARSVIAFLEEAQRAAALSGTDSADGAFGVVSERYDILVGKLRAETERIQSELHHLFTFAREAFADGDEMLILVTELTARRASARFIAAFGSEDYTRLSGELMLAERSAGIREELEAVLAGV